MNQKTLTTVVVAMLVLLMAGAGFVAYKLWNRKKIRAEAQRWEITMPLTLNRELGFEEMRVFLEDYNARLDRYEVMKPVVDELELVAFWSAADEAQAIETLRKFSGFREGDTPNTVLLVVSDKSKDMAGKLGITIGKHFDDMVRREQLLIPADPAGE